jgi:hypothetical protein
MSIRRAVSDTMITAGGALVLIMALVIFDDRVREQVSMRLHAQPAEQIVSAGHEVRNMTAMIVQAAHDQSITHAPLVIFSVAALVLTVFMLRT